MSVSSVSSTDSLTYVGSSSSSSSSSLSVDSETFLTLLVAQLKYQDPLEPQTDTAFVTQLAQMSTLTEMQDMNSALTSNQAYNLIGKSVYAEVLNEDTGITTAYSGSVDSVVIKSGSPYVVIGDTAIAVSNITKVYGSDSTDTSDDTTTT
jgi:flagellar basal-body rod modification protein FlgD